MQCWRAFFPVLSHRYLPARTLGVLVSFSTLDPRLQWNESVYNTFKEKATELGLVVQPGCCGSIKKAAIETSTTLSVPSPPHSTAILGSAIGCDGEEISKLTTKLVKEHDSFFDCLLLPSMPTQVAMHLLRKSGIPRLNYLLRTTRPSSILESATYFTNRVIDVALTKLDLLSTYSIAALTYSFMRCVRASCISAG